MKYSCKHCGQRIEADASWEGREVACPVCSASISIGPESVATAPTPAAGRRWFGVTAVVLALAAAGATAAVLGFKRAGESTAVPAKKTAAKKQPVSYEAQVQPILSKFCFYCHGDEKQKADLEYLESGVGLDPLSIEMLRERAVVNPNGTISLT